MTRTNTTAFEFVTAANGEASASTAIIAKQMKQQHASVIKLVRKYKLELEQFGAIGFEIQKGKALRHGGFARATEIAHLNEHQSALILSMMRNSEEVIKFKIALVTEFFRMREEIQSKDKNLWQQMQELIAKEVESKVKASFGSHLMLNRKREIPRFNDERNQLESAIQKPLFIN
jgi:phage regulator Rha-like protein